MMLSVLSHITSLENCHLLQCDLDNKSNWSTSNHLHFNTSKCTLLSFNSQLNIWHPHLLKDIIILERVQRRSTCFILNDYKSNYKSRLLKLNLLSLMYLLEYYDIMFFVTSLKNPSTHFNIQDYVKFSSFNTRSSTTNKVCYTFSPNNTSRHFYFTRLPRTWNSLPVINLKSVNCQHQKSN